MIFDWYDLTIEALVDLWQNFLVFIPKLVGAFVIFIIGWFIAMAIAKIVSEILRKLKFNQLFERGGIKQALEKAEFKFDASGFIGAIFKWVLVIVFLLVSVEILGLNQFGIFLTSVLNYLPNVIVAVLIFVVAVIITDILEKIIRAAVESAKIGYGNLVGIIVKWSIWIFTIFAIMYQLGIAPGLVQTLLSGIVGLIVIAGGIAFGLGGKDTAAEIVQELKRKIQK